MGCCASGPRDGGANAMFERLFDREGFDGLDDAEAFYEQYERSRCGGEDSGGRGKRKRRGARGAGDGAALQLLRRQQHAQGLLRELGELTEVVRRGVGFADDVRSAEGTTALLILKLRQFNIFPAEDNYSVRDLAAMEDSIESWRRGDPPPAVTHRDSPLCIPLHPSRLAKTLAEIDAATAELEGHVALLKTLARRLRDGGAAPRREPSFAAAPPGRRPSRKKSRKEGGAGEAPRNVE